MKRIKFVYNTGYSINTQILEFEDNVTSTQIHNKFEEWLLIVQKHSSFAIEVDENNKEIGEMLNT